MSFVLQAGRVYVCGKGDAVPMAEMSGGVVAVPRLLEGNPG